MRIFGFPRNQHLNADAYADGELGGPDLARFERHLAACKTCQATVADSRAIRAAITKLPQVAVPRSFAITPEMAAAARPARLRAATPVYLTFARAGAALSVAAFATVAAVTSLDSSSNDTASLGDDDTSRQLNLAEAASAGTPFEYESAATKSAEPSPVLAPSTSTGDAGGSGQGSVVPLGSPTPQPPITGAVPTPLATAPPPPPPAAGSNDGGPMRSSTGEDAFISPLADTSSAPLPAGELEGDNDGANAAVLGLGVLAGVAVVVLGVMEVGRRRRA